MSEAYKAVPQRVCRFQAAGQAGDVTGPSRDGRLSRRVGDVRAQRRCEQAPALHVLFQEPENIRVAAVGDRRGMRKPRPSRPCRRRTLPSSVATSIPAFASSTRAALAAARAIDGSSRTIAIAIAPSTSIASCVASASASLTPIAVSRSRNHRRRPSLKSTAILRAARSSSPSSATALTKRQPRKFLGRETLLEPVEGAQDLLERRQFRRRAARRTRASDRPRSTHPWTGSDCRACAWRCRLRRRWCRRRLHECLRRRTAARRCRESAPSSAASARPASGTAFCDGCHVNRPVSSA